MLLVATFPLPHWVADNHIIRNLSVSEVAQARYANSERSFTDTPTASQTTTSLGIRVFEFQEFARVGSANPAEPTPPKPEDLCTIMYTSGTTDVPKVIC